MCNVKIGIIAPYEVFPPISGAQKRVYRIAEELSACGAEVAVLHYGRSGASDIKQHPSSFKFIYITPSFFTLLLLLLSTIVFIFPKYPFSIIICGLAVIYLLVDFIASVHIGLKNNFKGFYWMIILFPLMHIGYGLGFLIGLLPRKKRLVKKRE